MFVLGKLLLPYLILASKVATYPNGAVYDTLAYVKAYDLTLKYWTKL